MQLRLRTLLAVAWVLLAAVTAAAADRPATDKLLPPNTVGIFSVYDVPELHGRHQQTAGHLIWQEPQLRKSLQQAFQDSLGGLAKLEQKVGFTLQELASIPRGEFTIAVAAGQEKEPMLFVIVDADGPALDRLIDKGLDCLRRKEVKLVEETIAGVRVSSAECPKKPGKALYWLRAGGTLAICCNRTGISDLAQRWTTGQGSSFADNAHYQAVMQRVRGPNGERPHLSWFVEPLAIMNAVGEKDARVAAGMAFAPSLGVDGLKGIGGSLHVATAGYDHLGQLHVLVDKERRGVMRVVNLRPVDASVERWVPANVVSYTKSKGDMVATMQEIRQIADSFGAGRFDQWMDEKVNSKLGINLEKDLLHAMEGTQTTVSILTEANGQPSPAHLHGIKLRDAAAFRPIMEQLAAKHGEHLEKQEIAGVTVWKIKLPAQHERHAENHAGDHKHGRWNRMLRKPPHARHGQRAMSPCIAIVGDSILLSDQVSALEMAIKASSQPQNPLAESVAYRRVVSRLEGTNSAVIHFHSPVEPAKYMHRHISSPEVRKQLAQYSGKCPFLKSLFTGLEQNGIPSFDALMPYFVPSGGMIVDDESGWHLTGFTLAR